MKSYRLGKISKELNVGMSRNPGVNWNEELISTFEENIIWQSMAHNLNLPCSIEFILKHEDVLFKSWTSMNNDFDQHIWKKYLNQ